MSLFANGTGQRQGFHEFTLWDGRPVLIRPARISVIKARKPQR